MGKKHTALEISEWLIAHNEEQVAIAGAEQISNLKLQKLLYYAQGCYLGMKGDTLFDDDILAWEHGPVVRSVYNKYREYGSDGIPIESIEEVPRFDSETQAILTEVYEVFGQYSAWKLRDMTHAETPWEETEKNDVISPESIRKYFKDNYIVE